MAVTNSMAITGTVALKRDTHQNHKSCIITPLGIAHKTTTKTNENNSTDHRHSRKKSVFLFVNTIYFNNVALSVISSSPGFSNCETGHPFFAFSAVA
jgi:hypothetical protein